MSKYRILETFQAQQDETDDTSGTQADGVPTGTGGTGSEAWTRKSFVLAQDKPGAVFVPSPVDGYAHRTGDQGTVELYDSPGTDGQLLGRVLHMDPRSFAVQEGEHVEYGQPLGRQWGAGPGNVKTQPDRVQVEMESEQLWRYLADIEAGLIAPDMFPGMTKRLRRSGLTLPPSAKAAIPIAVAIAALQQQRIVESGDRGPGVREVQGLLHTFGYLDGQGAPLRIDGMFGDRTREALESFQRVHGLEANGVAGPQTIAALHMAERQPLVSNPDHPDHSLYRQALDGLEKLDPKTFANAEERRNAAAALVLEAKLQGVQQIDHVRLDAGSGNVIAIQRGSDEETHRLRMDLKQAGVQPLEKSTLQLDHEKQMEVQRQGQTQVQKQVQTQELERRHDVRQEQHHERTQEQEQERHRRHSR